MATDGAMERSANNFDLLRLVFASLVMLYHITVLSGQTTGFFLFHLPTQAVDGFFVISGFLVAASCDRTDGTWRFYVKRALRLYPLYLVAILGQAAAMTLLLGFTYPGLWRELALYLAANLGFANFVKPAMGNALAGLPLPIINPSLWTLKIEVAFYLILPGIILLVRLYGRWVLLALLLGSIAYRISMGSVDATLARQLPGALQFFAVGMVAYFFRLDRYCRGPGALAACLVSAVLCFGWWDRLPEFVDLFVLGIFVLTFALALPALRLRHDISYGVYLLHAPLVQLLLLATRGTGLPASLPLWQIVPVICLATGILAFIAARAIEEPAVALGRHLAALPRLQLKPSS
jgi:peptidoglycan/LPS O-acetylase OafA/YrhL